MVYVFAIVVIILVGGYLESDSVINIIHALKNKSYLTIISELKSEIDELYDELEYTESGDSIKTINNKIELRKEIMQSIVKLHDKEKK